MGERCENHLITKLPFCAIAVSGIYGIYCYISVWILYIPKLDIPLESFLNGQYFDTKNINLGLSVDEL